MVNNQSKIIFLPFKASRIAQFHYRKALGLGKFRRIVMIRILSCFKQDIDVKKRTLKRR